MYSSVFIFIFVFILGMPVRVPSGLSLALSLCWWPCGWQCHGSPGKATGYSSERRRKNWSFHPHCATVLHSQFIQLAMALYLSFTFQSLIFKISTHWCIHQYKKLIEIYIYICSPPPRAYQNDAKDAKSLFFQPSPMLIFHLILP